MSNDPNFEDKLPEVVGLCLNPLENAVVFSIDEKNSIQASDHTQSGLPMKHRRAGTITHDYKRHGTTNLTNLSTDSGHREKSGASSLRRRARVEARFSWKAMARKSA